MRISFTAGTILDNKLFFSHNFFNALFEVDLDCWETRYVSKFPQESAGKRLLHQNAIVHDDKIIFFPNQGNNIHIFTPSTGLIEAISVCKVSDTRYSFSEGLVYDDKLYLFPGNLNQPINRIDLKNFEVRTIDIGLTDFFKDEVPDEQFFSRVVLKGDKIYSTMVNGNCILAFDLKKEMIDITRLDVEGLANIQKTNDDLWLTTIYSGVYLWDDDINNIKQVIGETKDEVNCYAILQSKSGRIYFVPDIGGEILTMEKDKENIEHTELEILPKEKIRRMGRLYEYGCSVKDGVLIFPTYNSGIRVLHENNMQSIEVSVVNMNDFKDAYSLVDIYGNSIMREGEVVDLNDFITML